MPMARTRRGRLKQVEKWLRVNYLPVYSIRVRFVTLPTKGSDRTFADCLLDDGHLTIRLHKNLTWHIATEALIHEWAHALTWDTNEEHHGPEWAACYGRIYSEFYDHGGCELSREL